MDPNGLWRIESNNFETGGKVEWHMPFRMRHFISGKYLYLEKKTIGLTHVKDKKSLFCF